MDPNPEPIHSIFPRFGPSNALKGPIRHPPLHFDADPDPAFHFDTNPDPAFHFDSDPDPASQNDADPVPDPQHC